MLKHQVRSKILFIFSFIVFAIPVFSFAQSRCPNRDCVFPIRAQGLNDALEAVGERAGNLRLQAAVLRQVPRPMMVQDDAGRTTCAWNCDLPSETGQARRWDIKVNGADERILPSATNFSEAEQRLYSGIGRVECPTAKGTAVGTAFLIGSYGTMVTTAHSFVDPDTNRKMSPQSCRVAFYNHDGSLREAAAISYVKSRWDEPGKFGDSSNDIAIIKLVGDSRTPNDVLPAVVPDRLTRATPVTVIGFSLDIPGQTIIKRVHGVAIQPPTTEHLVGPARASNQPINNPENLAVGSYDSNHGTSGSPLLNARGQIIGIHQGAQGPNGAEFNQTSSYNRAVIFDERFSTELNAVIARSSSI